MPSSTSIPSTRIKPNTDMTLMETGRPSALIASRAPSMEKGTPSITQNASDRSRNSARVISTSNAPCTALVSRSSIRPLSDTLRSDQATNSTPGGNSARLRSTNWRNCAVIASTSCSPTRSTSRVRLGLPLSRLSTGWSGNVSLTLATSPRVRRVPSSRVIRVRSANSSPL